MQAISHGKSNTKHHKGKSDCSLLESDRGIEMMKIACKVYTDNPPLVEWSNN